MAAEAGQLRIDEAIWRDGKVWHVVSRGAGIIELADDPVDGQINLLVLVPNDFVVRAGEALMDLQGEHTAAVERMLHARRSLDFDMAAERARKAMAGIVALESAGVVAGFELGGAIR